METETKDHLFHLDFVDKTRLEIRALMSVLDRADEADAITDRLATYFIDSCSSSLLFIATNYLDDAFGQERDRQLALWRDPDRLHHVIDHVIQYGSRPR